MKSIRHIALSIILTLGVFGAVLYTSCSKTGCSSVTCLNTGSCNGGICQCQTGTGGNSCEIEFRQQYAGTYRGSAVYTSSVLADTNFIAHADTGNTLTFFAGLDSMYTDMQLTWTRPGKPGLVMSIKLANFSATGATFTFQAPPIDTFTYTGKGSVNGTTATMNLIESHPNSPATVVTLSNFIKQ
jgi:hypothetical protein